jgi:hypothetical protein
MGDVIYTNFGAERVWDDAHQRLTETLLTVGAMFGDKDEDLLRAKADCAHKMIRTIVEEMPGIIDVTFQVPDNLPPEQCELVRKTLKEAANRGISIALHHAVEILGNSIFDLCTSKLSQQP